MPRQEMYALSDHNKLLGQIGRAVNCYLWDIRLSHLVYQWMKRGGRARAEQYLKRLEAQSYSEFDLAQKVCGDVLNQSPNGALGTSTTLREHLREVMVEYFGISREEIGELAARMMAIRQMSMGSRFFAHAHINVAYYEEKAMDQLLGEKRGELDQITVSRWVR